VPPEFVSDATKKDWLVWRHELRLLFRPLQQDEATHSPACRLAKISAAMCEGLCVWHAADEVRCVQHLLKHWIEQGLVLSCINRPPEIQIGGVRFTSLRG